MTARAQTPRPRALQCGRHSTNPSHRRLLGCCGTGLPGCPHLPACPPLVPRATRGAGYGTGLTLRASSGPLPLPSCPRGSPAHALGMEHRAGFHLLTRNHTGQLLGLPKGQLVSAPPPAMGGQGLAGWVGPAQGTCSPTLALCSVPLCHLATAWGLTSQAGLGAGLTGTPALLPPSSLHQAQGHPRGN